MAVWLFLNPQKSLIENKFREVWTHFYLSSFNRYILMSDFNSEPHETFMSYFMELCIFKKIVKLPTCFKNSENPSCIDLFLTNRPGYFQDNLVFETDISDFHKLVLRIHFKK